MAATVWTLVFGSAAALFVAALGPIASTPPSPMRIAVLLPFFAAGGFLMNFLRVFAGRLSRDPFLAFGPPFLSDILFRPGEPRTIPDLIAFDLVARDVMMALWVSVIAAFRGELAASFVGSVIGVAFCVLVVIPGSAVGAWAGLRSAEWLSPRLSSVSTLVRYIRAMAIPLAGFFLVWGAATVLFAAISRAIWLMDKAAYAGIDRGTVGEFIYFSALASAGVSYDIQPRSALARAAASVEIVLSIAWIVVGFASVVAHLQPRFAKITAEFRRASAKSSRLRRRFQNRRH